MRYHFVCWNAILSSWKCNFFFSEISCWAHWNVISSLKHFIDWNVISSDVPKVTLVFFSDKSFPIALAEKTIWKPRCWRDTTGHMKDAMEWELSFLFALLLFIFSHFSIYLSFSFSLFSFHFISLFLWILRDISSWKWLSLNENVIFRIFICFFYLTVFM